MIIWLASLATSEVQANILIFMAVSCLLVASLNRGAFQGSQKGWWSSQSLNNAVGERFFLLSAEAATSYLPDCLSCLSVCLSVCLSAVHLSGCLSLFACVPLCMFIVYKPFCLSI
jgi:hypothetical protein